MRRKPKNSPKPLQWRVECMGHSIIELLAACLPGPWAFHLGAFLGGIVRHFLPLRRKLILRNLRIAFAGEKDLPELQRMEKETFRRTAANMVCAAHTARLSPARLGEVIRIENMNLLEDALATGKGVVLLLSHMGNWEILSRIIHLFPPGSKTGAFYRPLNNPRLDRRVLDRRQADGTTMFSKHDNLLQVAGFLRNGGIVGILADQRVGIQGELVEFFGRITRASPLPSLLARRSKSRVLALSVATVAPGKWTAAFSTVDPPGTPQCMSVLEQAMKRSPVDVFWFQERWKVFVRRSRGIRDWLGDETKIGAKPHRALIWLVGAPAGWQFPENWLHPDVIYEAAVSDDAIAVHPARSTHRIRPGNLRRTIATIDASAILPLDFIVAPCASAELLAAGQREAIPVISLP